MPKSLKGDLKNLKKKERLSLHMPGHKGFRLREDTTELADTDNLLNPKGSILELEKAIADIYGGKNCYLGTNGSTSLLLGSLFLAGEKKKVVLPRASHLSIYKGLISGNHEPFYLENEIDELEIARPLKPEAYLKILKENADVYIFTTPSYEGYLENYTILKPFLKDKLTIIDSAHGSHLYYIKKDENLWVDLKVMSFHKTLGALNQGGGVISNLEENIREKINFFQTSSPSFPILLSIEDSIREMMKLNISQKTRFISWFKSEADKIEGLKVVENDDPFKLLISSPCFDLKKLATYLREEKGIYFEIENSNYLLGLFSFYDSFESYNYLLKELKKGIRKLARSIEKDKRTEGKREYIHIPERKYLPGEAFKRDKKLISLTEAKGEVSGVLYSKYPLGVSALVPGEVIDEKVLEDILNHREDYTGCQEIEEGKIFVIK